MFKLSEMSEDEISLCYIWVDWKIGYCLQNRCSKRQRSMFKRRYTSANYIDGSCYVCLYSNFDGIQE